MKGLFSPDGPFVKYGGKAWDLLWLNILTVLCCLPIVTISTSFSAMHYVLLKIWRDEEQGITGAFFRSFFLNLRQNVVIQLLYLVVGYLLVACWMLLRSQGATLMLIGLVIVAVLLLCVWLWVVILQSRYTNTIVKTFKHALAACLAHPGRTALMAVVFALPFFLLLFEYRMLIVILAVGFTAPGIWQTYLYNSIFKQMELEEDITEEEQ